MRLCCLSQRFLRGLFFWKFQINRQESCWPLDGVFHRWHLRFRFYFHFMVHYWGRFLCYLVQDSLSLVDKLGQQIGVGCFFLGFDLKNGIQLRDLITVEERFLTVLLSLLFCLFFTQVIVTSTGTIDLYGTHLISCILPALLDELYPCFAVI